MVGWGGARPSNTVNNSCSGVEWNVAGPAMNGGGGGGCSQVTSLPLLTQSLIQAITAGAQTSNRRHCLLSVSSRTLNDTLCTRRAI